MNITLKIQEYKVKVVDRWHTPGHKGVLWEDDITEIGEDYFPANLIEVAESKTADFYNTKKLRFLTGGSSMGIKAAILAVGGDIIVGANSHRAVWEAAELAKVNVFVIENEVKDGLALPLNSQQIKAAIKEHKSAKAVVITSPDYYGRVCSYDVLDAVKDAGLLLIADSAHGAHFDFRPDLFPKSFAHGADFCNMSAHKTLCALTMGAYLCVNNEQYFEAADRALKNLGTTSPLYPLLNSLENAITVGSLYKNVYDNLKSWRDDLKKDIKLLDNDDFTRIVVDANALGLSGKQLFDKLFELKVAAEMHNDRYVVFISTPFDDEGKFMRLKSAIQGY